MRNFIVLCFCFALCKDNTFAQKADKYYLKGVELYNGGKYESAISNFQKALENGYENTALLNFSLGNAYQYWEKYPDAIRYYQLALNLKYENQTEILFQISTAYFHLRDYPNSIEYCNRIFEASPKTKDARVYWRLNLIYSIQGNTEKALEIIKRGAVAGIQEFQLYCEKREINWRE